MSLMLSFSLQELVSLGVLVAGATAWMIRLEGKARASAARIAEVQSNLLQFYATKQELATAMGTVARLEATGSAAKEGVERIERKLDALMAAGLAGSAPHQSR
jgi:hypothetical protein